MGAVLLLAGVALMMTHGQVAPYIYMVGAVTFSYVQVVHDRYEGRNFVIKRLRRQQIFGAIALILAGVFMFTLRHNEWIVCLTVAALLELYTSFRIPQELEKEK
jgi:uncharacterized membrane protein YiaA